MNDSVMVALKELRDLEDKRVAGDAAKRRALVDAERRAREDAERKVAEGRARDAELARARAEEEGKARKAEDESRLADLERRLEAERRMRAEIEMRIHLGPNEPEARRSFAGVVGWSSAGIAATALGFAFFVMTQPPQVVERSVVVEVPAERPEEPAAAPEPDPVPVVVSEVPDERPGRPIRPGKRPPQKQPPVENVSGLEGIDCDEDDPTCGLVPSRSR